MYVSPQIACPRQMLQPINVCCCLLLHQRTARHEHVSDALDTASSVAVNVTVSKFILFHLLNLDQRGIDLAFCKTYNYNGVFNSRVREPFSTSHLRQVSFREIHKPVLDFHVFVSRDFRSAELPSIKTHLNFVDFSNLFDSIHPPSIIQDEFYQIINSKSHRSVIQYQTDRPLSNTRIAKDAYYAKRALPLTSISMQSCHSLANHSLLYTLISLKA